MIKTLLLFILLPLVCIGQQINPNFGNNGSVVTDYANDLDFFGDLLTLSDGKLILFGNSKVATNQNLNGFAIIKYNTDGSYDNSFGIRGKVILNFDSYQNSTPTSAIVQNDGKILITGNTANNSRGALTRLLPNGAIDSDFGFNGKVLLESKEVNKVLLTADQKIVVIGKTANDFSIEKLNNDGFYDLTFGNNGVTTLDDNNTFEVFTSGQIMNDGSIICIGNSSNPNFQANKVVFTKFSPNGIFDSNFGLKRINMPSIPNTSHFNNYIRDFKFLSDNSMILLVDGSYTDFQGSGHSRIYKADSNGNLITSFGNGGYYQFSNTNLQNMLLLDNGKILITLAGSGNHSVSVYLFNTDGSLNTDFGTISIGLQNDFTNVAKTAIYDNKIFTAYNRTDARNDYYINSYLIDNQLLATSDFENSLENTVIYPNPFTDKININLKGMDFQKLKISVFNISGSEILSTSYEPIDDNPLLPIYELSKYSAGIYFLKIQSDTYSKTFKIIKK